LHQPLALEPLAGVVVGREQLALRAVTEGMEAALLPVVAVVLER